MSVRRRFIAGAVCPRCARMDKIVVDLDTDRRECVACGYSEPRPCQERSGQERSGQERSGQERSGQESDQPATELPTRVSRPAARRVETPAEPVRLIDPPE
jgi:hypothetical protein